MRLGILGGTFDPPHLGHQVLAERAREQLALERVLWVPAGDPWRKEGRGVTEASHRLAMARLAVEGNPAFEVSASEVERGGPSYSAVTLAELAAESPEAELYFIGGLDTLEDLPHWHEPQRLIELALLTVAERDGGRRTPEELDALLPGLGARVRWIAMPRLDISATELRARAARGESLRYLVPAAVEYYIREHGLYQHD